MFFDCIRDNVKGCLIVAPLWSDTLMRRAFFVLQPYLTEVWKISFTHAAAIVNIWEGTSLMLPAVFQLLADKYLGNFKVVVFSVFSSTLGLALVTMSLPGVTAIGTCKEYVKGQECKIVGEQKGLMYLGVALTAIGRGGLTVGVPCLHDEQGEGGGQFCLCGCVQKHVSTAENLCVYLIGTIIISVISSWTFRFGFPAIFAAAVALFFFGGWSVYKKAGPKRKGSLLSTVFRVFAAPRVSRNQATAEESSFVRHITGISITFIILGIVSALSNTFFVEQANNMNRKFLFITLPLAAFQLPMLIAAVAWPCLCTACTFLGWANDYCWRCIPQCLRIIPSILGIVAALFHAILCCVVAAAVEKRRHRGANGSVVEMHATWLIFQFYLVACVDIFFRSSIESYYHAQAPSKLRDFHIVYTDFVTGFGYLSSVILVAIVRKISEMGEKGSWFEFSVNQSRLDRYYWMLGIMGCLSLGAFCGMAPFSICKDVRPPSSEREREKEKEKERGVEKMKVDGRLFAVSCVKAKRCFFCFLHIVIFLLVF